MNTCKPQLCTVPALLTITVTIVYFTSEVHCTSNVLYSTTIYAINYKCKGNLHIMIITVQSSTIIQV